MVNTNAFYIGPVKFTVKTALTSTADSTVYYLASSQTCEVKVGTSDTVMAATIAAAANNHPQLRKLVYCTSASDTVTITAVTAGAAGKKIVATRSSGTTITFAGSTVLTDGWDAVGPQTLGTAPAAGVVKVFAMQPGGLGNTVALATNDSGCAVSAATLTGGAGDDKTPVLLSLA